MPTFSLDRFIGRIPRLSDQNIPDTAATIARNLRLLSGNLRALHTPEPVETFDDVTAYIPRYAFRVLEANLVDDDPILPGPNFYPEAWAAFRYKGTKVVKGPITQDQYERYYWTNEGQEAPRYIRRGLIDGLGGVIDGNILGILQPASAPTVTPQNTGTADDETRSYVYTYVSVYGEEGPPSASTEATGDPTLPWDITNLLEDLSVDREIETKRIYRTVVGQATTEFVFVAEIDNAVTSYQEPGNSDIAGNSLLESTTWFPPPATLDGLVAHPNGFLVGFSGFDIHFSEPFHPHAWPVDYVVSVDTPIVALAVIDTSVVVLTQGSPHIISGVAPESMAKTTIQTAMPCLSRYSVVVMPDGVYYTSNRGLARVVAESVSVISQSLIDAEQWRRDFAPELVTAAQDQEYYLAFTSDTKGYFFAPGDPADTLIDLDSFSGIDNIFTDRLDGQVYLMRGGTLFQWDPPTGSPLVYQWRSKQFVFPQPCNLGAALIDFDASEKTATVDLSVQSAYNQARLESSRPLHPIGYAPIGGSRYEPGIVPDQPQTRLPLGGSSLFNLAVLTGTGAVRLTVIARGSQVFSDLITTESVRRLPATVKADKWQFELQGNTDVFYAKFAETARSLAGV